MLQTIYAIHMCLCLCVCVCEVPSIWYMLHIQIYTFNPYAHFKLIIRDIAIMPRLVAFNFRLVINIFEI